METLLYTFTRLNVSRIPLVAQFVWFLCEIFIWKIHFYMLPASFYHVCMNVFSCVVMHWVGYPTARASFSNYVISVLMKLCVLMLSDYASENFLEHCAHSYLFYGCIKTKQRTCGHLALYSFWSCMMQTFPLWFGLGLHPLPWKMSPKYILRCMTCILCKSCREEWIREHLSWESLCWDGGEYQVVCARLTRNQDQCRSQSCKCPPEER